MLIRKKKLFLVCVKVKHKRKETNTRRKYFGRVIIEMIYINLDLNFLCIVELAAKCITKKKL